MPNILTKLIIDRVDLVDEGANSAAFIEFYKRKENTDSMDLMEIIEKMKPEHASVVQAELDKLEKTAAERDELAGKLETVSAELVKANEAVATAEAELEAANEALEEQKKAGTAPFDEDEVLKSMPEAARESFIKMRTQKEAAEEALRKSKEETEQAEAVAKAASLKNIPVETSELAAVIKGAPTNLVDLLVSIDTAIGATVLDELGKRGGGPPAGNSANEAWNKIEAAADIIEKRDGVTKQKAISMVIEEQPNLYKEYIEGGAN